MSRHHLRHLGLATWLVMLWVLLWADLSVANVASGALLAGVVIVATRRIDADTATESVRVAPIALVRFIAHVLWQLVKSNVFLAWEIVTPTNTIRTGTVEVPLRSSSPIITMAVSNVITMTPGTVTLGASVDPPKLVVGVLHLHEPDEIRAGVRRTEELAIAAFGSAAARSTLDEEYVR
ncbi:MAG: Na+/H+ antiporter subunit E [Ilumatobacteraceae bacterium]